MIDVKNISGMRVVFYALISLFLMTSLVWAEPPTEEWIATYNGTGNRYDRARDMVVDSAGNVYVTGFSVGDVTSVDYATVKYDASGTQQWVARHNGTGNGTDQPKAMTVDNNGNVYVTGDSWASTFTTEIATVKYNSEGVQQWVASYNNSPISHYDVGKAIKVDSDGNVYVAGESLNDLGKYDYVTIKYDSTGTQQWLKRYNGLADDHDRALDLAIDDVGNVYVTGESVGAGTQFDIATVKYDNDGVQQWVSRYNTVANNHDRGQKVLVDNDGNVYVGGVSIGPSSRYDFATIKYDNAGVQQWVARYDAPSHNSDYLRDMAIDNSGNVYVTGSGYDFTNGYHNYSTIKYDTAGNQLWLSRYDGPANYNDYPQDIALDSDGNVYVTGFSQNADRKNEYASVKYDNAGVQQWAVRYHGPENLRDEGRRVAVDSNGNVYVSGDSVSTESNFDFVTFKYSQSTNKPPVAQFTVTNPIECTGAETNVTFDASSSSDPDGDALTYSWVIDGVAIGSGSIFNTPLTLGSHTIDLTVDDGQVSDSASMTVEVNINVAGLLPPLASLVDEGDEPTMPNKAFKHGRTLPLKLELACGSTLLNSADVAAPTIVSIAPQGATPLDLAVIEPDAGEANDNGLLFRFADPQWVYNLNTKDLMPGTVYDVTIKMPDGRNLVSRFALK